MPRTTGARTMAWPDAGWVSRSTWPTTNGATPVTFLFEATVLAITA